MLDKNRHHGDENLGIDLGNSGSGHRNSGDFFHRKFRSGSVPVNFRALKFRSGSGSGKIFNSGRTLIVDEIMFVAPSTPQFWFSGRVGIKCEGIGRVKVATGSIAVLFVPSRGALLGFWHGALSLLRLGRLRRAWGRRHGRCC